MTVVHGIFSFGGDVLHKIGPPSITPDQQGEVAVFFGMSPTNKAQGIREGQDPSFRITFTAPVTTGDDGPDWDKEAQAPRVPKEFVHVHQETGKAQSYPETVVVSSGSTTGDDRTTDRNIVLLALYRNPPV